MSGKVMVIPTGCAPEDGVRRLREHFSAIMQRGDENRLVALFAGVASYLGRDYVRELVSGEGDPVLRIAEHMDAASGRPCLNSRPKERDDICKQFGSLAYACLLVAVTDDWSASVLLSALDTLPSDATADVDPFSATPAPNEVPL